MAIPRFLFPVLALAGLVFVPVDHAYTQSPSTVSFQTLRPFVIGFTPVVGNGAVGGVSIDTSGVVCRANLDDSEALRLARLKSASSLTPDLAQTSTMRMISLRKLEANIERLVRDGKPLTEAMHCLAGLQRIQYIFIYPDQRDVVLAGYAEGWQVDAAGNLVGTNTGFPVILLEDLLTALRTAKAAEEHGITCSIDPTAAGLARWQKLMQGGNLPMNKATLTRMEKAIGPQQITVTGVSPGSHFARVLVSADFLMKRLALGFESAPIEGLPSYLKMIETSPLQVSAAQQPRWWLAPRYDALWKDSDGLTWQLRGPGVAVLTEDSRIAAGGGIAGTGKSSPLANEWAAEFTSHYEELSRKLPVFADLRNCIDLAVASAILVRQDFCDNGSGNLALLLDAKKLPVAETHFPKSVDSEASFVKKGSSWVVSISGGVEINSWAASDHVEISPTLSHKRAKAVPIAGELWWWD